MKLNSCLEKLTEAGKNRNCIFHSVFGKLWHQLNLCRRVSREISQFQIASPVPRLSHFPPKSHRVDLRNGFSLRLSVFARKKEVYELIGLIKEKYFYGKTN